MSENRRALEDLFSSEQIALERGHLFSQTPLPMPTGFDFGFVEGMMWGLAIGDSLGNTTEGLLPNKRRNLFGEVRDYVSQSQRTLGLPSDDTQLAFWTLEQLILDGGLNPDHLADRFCQGQIFGIGNTVREFIGNREKGAPWERCGPHSAGNGALMRIAPMLIPHLMHPSADLWADTAISAMLTHNDSASNSACLTFTYMFWELLRMTDNPEPRWWLDTYVEIAKDLEGASLYRPRGGEYMGYDGPLWQFVSEHVGEAFERGCSAVEACDRWFSGAYLLETVPSVIYILMLHGAEPEEAIVRAVNDTKDNDTVAAIVGAAVGALHGKDRLPYRWLSGLSGRTKEDDDGQIGWLIDQARKRFWKE